MTVMLSLRTLPPSMLPPWLTPTTTTSFYQDLSTSHSAAHSSSASSTVPTVCYQDFPWLLSFSSRMAPPVTKTMALDSSRIANSLTDNGILQIIYLLK